MAPLFFLARDLFSLPFAHPPSDIVFNSALLYADRKFCQIALRRTVLRKESEDCPPICRPYVITIYAIFYAIFAIFAGAGLLRWQTDAPLHEPSIKDF